MKHYLSSGMGVNSVALHLLMLQEGYDFESIFVNHGTDWPETYEYLDYFQAWLAEHGHRPVTVLEPSGKFKTIIDKCEAYKIVPHMRSRWCTVGYKVEICNKYYSKPCFQHLGFDAGEEKRAKISISQGIENRWLLIEHGIDREGCRLLISRHGLKQPMKSGCYICPMQRQKQWRQLRRRHPCLFKRAENLEKLNMEYARSKQRRVYTLSGSKKPLGVIVDENQPSLWPEHDYPPCECEIT